MNALVRRGRAWAPSVKAAALFVLPLPLLVAILSALIAGDVLRFALAGWALGCFWGAGLLVLRALAAEARYFLGERADPPAVPLKLFSAVLTALGAALAATAGGHTLAGALLFAALGAAGHVAFYGRDLAPRRIRVSLVEGIDSASVALQLRQAYQRLRAIETAGLAIAPAEFRERLYRIADTGRAILAGIERDPADAARARRFLNLYLESAERVTVEYARTHRQVRDPLLEQNFRHLLVEIEGTFAEQHKRVVERDVLALDVDIEVLNSRLRREGPG
jgi:hypothetical protein